MSEIARLHRSMSEFDGLTAEEIRDRLARLGAGDPEAAHCAEDELARAALAAIRDGHPNPAALARDVLTVLSADFTRWYA